MRALATSTFVALLCFAASACLFAVGCDDGGGGIDSGVAGNKQLEDVTSNEAEKICDAAEDYAKAALPARVYMRAACVQVGLTTGDVEQCREVQAACESGEESDGGDGLPIGPVVANTRDVPVCFEPAQLESCGATVAELESCYEALISQRVRELYSQRCESLVSGTRGPIIDEGGEPPVCLALDKRCAGLGNLLTTMIEQPEVDGGRPPIIEPPPEPPSSCSEYSLGFDGSDCSRLGCNSLTECSCDIGSMSFTTCNSIFGCLSSVDCDVACAAGYSATITCASDTSCETDSDCDGYYCVNSGIRGTCSRGEPGNGCNDSGDCASGECSTTSFTCTGNGAEGEPCDTDSECASNICYLDFSASVIQGVCSSGAAGEPCSSDDECVDGACAYQGSTSVCTDGSESSPCDDDGDCDSGFCVYGSASYASCTDGQYGSACDSSTDCVSQRCVTPPGESYPSCAYAPGDECPLGIADCNGVCQVSQGSCGTSLCVPECAGGSCSGETFATWNAADASGSTALSNGDLTATTTSVGDGVRASLGKSTGTYYWEVRVDALSGFNAGGIGVTSLGATLGGGLGTSSSPGVGFSPSGTITSSDVNDTTTGVCTFTVGSVIGVALDASGDLVYFSVDGVWQGGADPEGGSGGIAVDITGEEIFPVLELWSGDTYTANFGQSTFMYPPPTGYEPLY